MNPVFILEVEHQCEWYMHEVACTNIALFFQSSFDIDRLTTTYWALCAIHYCLYRDPLESLGPPPSFITELDIDEATYSVGMVLHI